jgi:hypothetical protein
MQPQPTEVSQNTQSVESAAEPSELSHHGIQHDHDQASCHLLSRGDGRAPNTPLHQPAAVLGGPPVSPQPRVAQTSSVGWVNDNIRPKPGTPIDRISQYEQALTPSPRKSPDLVGFKVVSGKKGGLGTPITDFPNGTASSCILYSSLDTNSAKRCSRIFYRIFHLSPCRQFPLYPVASTRSSQPLMRGELLSPDTSQDPKQCQCPQRA